MWPPTLEPDIVSPGSFPSGRARLPSIRWWLGVLPRDGSLFACLQLTGPLRWPFIKEKTDPGPPARSIAMRGGSGGDARTFRTRRRDNLMVRGRAFAFLGGWLAVLSAATVSVRSQAADRARPVAYPSSVPSLHADELDLLPLLARH